MSFATNFTRYLAGYASETYTEFGFSAGLAYRFADPLGMNGRNWLATLSLALARASYDQPDTSVDPTVSRQQNDTTVSDRKSTRLNSSHVSESRMPSSA